MRTIGLPFLFATLTAGNTWTGQISSSLYQTSTCIGAPILSLLTSISRLNDGCSCIQGTSNDGQFFQKQCHTCPSDGSVTVHWTHGCNDATCSVCSTDSGSSGTSTYQSAAAVFDYDPASQNCNPFTYTPDGGTASMWSSIQSGQVDSATFSAAIGCVEVVTTTLSGDNPCFAAMTTMACKVSLPTTTAQEAYQQCYRKTPGDAASLVLMTDLSAGDTVLAADAKEGNLSLTRVVVNQHKGNTRASSFVELHHSAGVLALTPDHIIAVNGVFAPAQDATPGSMLTLAGGKSAVVEQVTTAFGAIINPVTDSGTILAIGLTGEPVVAATHPEWSAAFMMANKAPLPLFYSLSAVFPATTQAYYEAVLEPILDTLGPNLGPAALFASNLVLPFYAADAASALGIAAFACTTNGLALGLAVAGGVFALRMNKS